MTHTRVRRGPLWFASLVLAAVTLAAAPTVSAASEFPAGWEGYHTYGEVDAFLDAAVASYGQGTSAILDRFTIGQSFEGRNIWAVKISDNVATDENEPEVLSQCGMHAREILTVEMCLYMIRLLTDNYGNTSALGQRITNIVDSREIWIVPNWNPDGSEFNISGGTFHNWRKNRQINPGSDKRGIDLNRNWGFMWNCCGGASGNPGSARYRGRHPFEAPENAVMRDFILSRRVDGRQQIKIAFNWHSYGEAIMWPYGYTKQDVPKTMTVDDHDALVTIGKGMAALNGYKTKQGSDLYIYDGDFMAWAYGDQRIIGFTFEMYPRYGCNGCGGFKPPDEVIQAETTRNREAVLYFIEQADCPYRAAGLEATHCGPLNDDFETSRGWTFDPDGDDTATGPGSGAWQRGIPVRTADSGGVKQRSTVTSGQQALVTGRAGGGATANDLDGATSVLSPKVKLGGGEWTMSFRFSFAHGSNATTDDFLRIRVVDGATTTTLWEVRGQASNRNAQWMARTISLDSYAGQDIRLLIDARDGDADNLLEAAIDDVRVYQTP